MSTGITSVAVACLFALFATRTRAGEVLLTEVTHDDGRYAVRFDVRIAAPRDRLAFYLTDYANYAKYFNSITASRVEPRGETSRVFLTLSSCVLFFCRSVRITKDVSNAPDGTIVGHIVPGESDFEEADERWRIVAEKGATRLRYEAELVPDFYVPPLIGPWLIRYKIRDVLETNAEKLERLAAH
jgi:hypothetical protein